MPKFAANLSFLFTEVPFEERFALAAAAGFTGVEYLFPYDWPQAEIQGWLGQAGLKQVLFNLPPGNWAAGDRGMACIPGREAEFAESVELALDYARALHCPRVHCMAGLRPAGAEESAIEACYIANVRRAADRLAMAGITVLIEPINSRIDMPGYWLDDVERGFSLLARVDRENVKLQLDLYHAQIIQGDLARTLATHLDEIGHIQIADNPGRHQPGTGEIHFPYLFERLDALGYGGWVGCEYRPTGATSDSFEWLEKLC